MAMELPKASQVSLDANTSSPPLDASTSTPPLPKNAHATTISSPFHPPSLENAATANVVHGVFGTSGLDIYAASAAAATAAAHAEATAEAQTASTETYGCTGGSTADTNTDDHHGATTGDYSEGDRQVKKPKINRRSSKSSGSQHQHNIDNSNTGQCSAGSTEGIRIATTTHTSSRTKVIHVPQCIPTFTQKQPHHWAELYVLQEYGIPGKQILLNTLHNENDSNLIISPDTNDLMAGQGLVKVDRLTNFSAFQQINNTTKESEIQKRCNGLIATYENTPSSTPMGSLRNVTCLSCNNNSNMTYVQIQDTSTTVFKKRAVLISKPITSIINAYKLHSTIHLTLVFEGSTHSLSLPAWLVKQIDKTAVLNFYESNLIFQNVTTNIA